MKYILTSVFLLVIILGCNEQSTEPLPSDPYERWKSYNLHNYTIEQVRVCFCGDGGAKMKITVQTDTIASVVKLLNNEELPYTSARSYLTVDSLFSIIRNNETDSLVILYHSQYGYPETLDINPQEHPVDGGVLIVTSNLQKN